MRSRHDDSVVHGKEAFRLYVLALEQLFALCGVPLAMVVGVAVVVRTINVLASRRE